MGHLRQREKTSMATSRAFLLILPLVHCLPPPPEYPTPAPTQEYSPDIGQTNVGGYGVNKNPYCHMVEKVVFKNQWKTTPKLLVGPKIARNANRSLTITVPVSLRQTLEETYQVQRCFTGKDRVCDTTYKIDMTTKDDY